MAAMVNSTVLTLVAIPAVYSLIEVWGLPKSSSKDARTAASRQGWGGRPTIS